MTRRGVLLSLSFRPESHTILLILLFIGLSERFKFEYKTTLTAATEMETGLQPPWSLPRHTYLASISKQICK